jgi:hypothetical protein
MIARVVEKHVDQRRRGVERLQAFQEFDRRSGVDDFDFDHLGLAGFQVDGAMNIETLAPRRLFDRQRLVLGRPTSRCAGGMGRMHRVREDHDLVRGQGIQQVLVKIDEGALLVLVEMARDDLGLAILEAEAMQKRDQSRATAVFHAQFRRDPSADLTRRARRDRSDPRRQLLLLRFTQRTGAASGFKPHQRLSTSFGERAMPTTDRVIVQQQHPGDLLATQTIVEQNKRVGATRQSMRHRTIPRQSHQGGTFLSRQKAGANHALNRIQFSALGKSSSCSQ